MGDWHKVELQEDIDFLMETYGGFHDSWQDNYLCLILDAYLAFHNGLLPGSPDRVIVWSDTDCFDINMIDNSIAEPADTYIVANELRWRILQENPHDRDN